ncbi:VanZ family protein [Paenibacillus gyeongsangnamensis]|uniref:VanZ family protein n=1 Tax=Paenibacillus gyeongsangnamensis TaxID=3388067 RepID=UPI0039083B01
MRLFAVILWALVLFIFTCNISLHALLNDKILFIINPHPKYRDLFIYLDYNLVHPYWIIVKLGHVIGFAIMDFLLFWWTRKRTYAALLTITLALLTEILQLFFNRDGRIYDVVIDSVGILISYYASKLHKTIKIISKELNLGKR